MNVLDIKDLEVRIGEAYILQGVTFSVPKNEVVVLLGKNGAGKTTTLESIVGISPPDETPQGGSIYLDEEEITELPPYERAKKGIGFVPGTARIFGSLTVRENLKMGMIKEEIDEERIQNVIDIFPFIDDYLDHEGNALSGGEQKMLSLARGMVYGKDKILLVDEPTEGLSPENSRKTVKALEKAKKQTSILLVTGSFKIARKLGDRYALMSQGKIVEEGKMEELTQDSDIVQRYLAATKSTKNREMEGK